MDSWHWVVHTKAVTYYQALNQEWTQVKEQTWHSPCVSWGSDMVKLVVGRRALLMSIAFMSAADGVSYAEVAVSAPQACMPRARYSRIRATDPATTGVAIDVPFMCPVLWERLQCISLQPACVCMDLALSVQPGASTSGFMRPSQAGPRDEKGSTEVPLSFTNSRLQVVSSLYHCQSASAAYEVRVAPTATTCTHAHVVLVKAKKTEFLGRPPAYRTDTSETDQYHLRLRDRKSVV